MSLTRTLIDGRFNASRPCSSSRLASNTRIRPSTVCAGDDTGCDTLVSTGRIASSPASGSRMMPEKNDDAAPFGRPGRTVTVIRRAERPSM